MEKTNPTLQDLIDQLAHKTKEVKLGGGQARIDLEHQKRKLTARERIEYLIDKESRFLEIGTFAADGLYDEEGAAARRRSRARSACRRPRPR